MAGGLKYPVARENLYLPSSDSQWREYRRLGQAMAQDPPVSSLFLNTLLTFREYVAEKMGFDPKIDSQFCAAVVAIDEIFPEWRQSCNKSEYFPEVGGYEPDQDMIIEVDLIKVGLSAPKIIDPAIYKQFESIYKYTGRLKSLVEHIMSLQIYYVYQHSCQYLNPENFLLRNALDIGNLAVTIYQTFFTKFTALTTDNSESQMRTDQRAELDIEIQEFTSELIALESARLR